MRSRWWLTALAVVIVGLVAVAVWVTIWPPPRPAPRPAPSRRVAPTPEKPAPARQPTPPVPDYTPLRQELQAYLASQPARYSLYFKDLESGAAFGIDEDRPVPAASSIKVPIVLYLNQLVAEGKASFDTRVTYSPDRHFESGAGVLQMAAVEGDAYSLRVLANLAITISDNIATQMLLDYLGRENVEAFMRSIGGQTVYPEGRNISTARDMAAYVEAVLDFAKKHPALGERLLDDMAHPIYHVGLPGELPADIRVAHKEGEVESVANDVGVVLSKRPFILAVLSDGQDDPLRGFPVIAHLTRMIYDYQNKLP